MAKVNNALPIEKELNALPENSAVRLQFRNALGVFMSVHENFLDEIMYRRGGSSKRKDALKPKIVRELNAVQEAGGSYHIEVL